MKRMASAFIGGFKAELIQLRRSQLLLCLTTIQSITFIILVYFFGTTGAFAPTALIDQDKGYYAQAFIKNLNNAHHSFDLRFMDEQTAMNAVQKGKLVAVITIPKGFSEAIDNGETTPLKVVVDNIDTDMTADIQRALPAAITAFAQEYQLPGIHVQTEKVNLIDHDTGFIPYLSVSALALSALIVSGILAAVTVAREFESKTFALTKVSPVDPFIPIIGRIFATHIVAMITMTIASSIVIWGHGVIPAHPWEMIGALFAFIIIFGWMGASIGALMKQMLPVASFIFGISLPLYLFSGTYEPERFDGNIIWTLAHFTPLYYAVGVIEHAMLNLRVTPESFVTNCVMLAGWGLLSILSMYYFLRRNVS